MLNPPGLSGEPKNYPIRVDIDASLSGKNKRQAHPIFGQITKNTTIILIYMGKIKGFLFAVRHREILMRFGVKVQLKSFVYRPLLSVLKNFHKGTIKAYTAGRCSVSPCISIP